MIRVPPSVTLSITLNLADFFVSFTARHVDRRKHWLVELSKGFPLAGRVEWQSQRGAWAYDRDLGSEGTTESFLAFGHQKEVVKLILLCMWDLWYLFPAEKRFKM